MASQSHERSDHDDDDNDGDYCDDTHGPVHALATCFLMILRLLNVLFSFLCVFKSCSGVMIDLDQV